MSNSNSNAVAICNYLENFNFAKNALIDDFSIVINKNTNTISSVVNKKTINTLKLIQNNNLHKNLCIRLLVHISAMELCSKLNIIELNNCKKQYKNNTDIFMKEKKNMVGFIFGVVHNNKKFAEKNFEEWKINSQDSCEKILDFATDKNAQISIATGIRTSDKVPINNENTYLRIQKANKNEYDDMTGLLDICNICGYWK